jgi:hypothetical protein
MVALLNLPDVEYPRKVVEWAVGDTMRAQQVTLSRAA